MKRIFVICCVATAFVASAPTSAHAQEGEGAATAAAVLTSAGVIGGALLVGGVTTTVAVVLSDPKRKVALERYLRANEPAVRNALAMGGGEAIRDLAEILHVPDEELAAFGARLRRHRSDLLNVAYEQIDPDAFARIATGTPLPEATASTGG